MLSGVPRSGFPGGPVALAVLLAAAAACYPSGVETVDDLNTVTTVHDGGTNFGSFITFAVADQVKYLQADGGTTSLPPALGNPLINAVSSNMTARGYTQIVPTLVNRPDLAMTLGVVTVTYTNIYVTYPWCDYWGYYYPYCSGWGRYYPPITGVTQYDVGTVVVTMSTNDDANSRADGVWVAAVRGVLTGNDTTDVQRAVTGINQAFTQSPYIAR